MTSTRRGQPQPGSGRRVGQCTSQNSLWCTLATSHMHTRAAWGHGFGRKQRMATLGVRPHQVRTQQAGPGQPGTAACPSICKATALQCHLWHCLPAPCGASLPPPPSSQGLAAGQWIPAFSGCNG